MNKVINDSQPIFSIWVHTCYLSLCDYLESLLKNQVEDTSFIPHFSFLYRSKYGLSYSQDFNAVHRITEEVLPGLSCTQGINKTYTFSFLMLSSTWMRVRYIWAYRQSGRLFPMPSFSITGLTVTA